MKAGLLSVAGLSALAVAQPHGQAHRHLHKKDVVVTETQMATATAPRAVVYVDANGNQLYTSWGGDSNTQPTQAPEPYSAPEEEEETTSSPAPQPTPETTEAPAPSYAEPTTSAAPAPTSTSSGSDSSEGSDSSIDASGYSIVYSPYNADGTCKDQSQVDMDFEQISGYSMVRTYGTDCNQTATVLTAARAHDMKLFAGIFDISNIDGEVSNIIDATNGDFSNIHTISVGNELVNNGQYSASDVVSAMNNARGQLSGAGYNGNIVTVDTFVAMIANPELCEASDYAAANCHAFFDGGVSAEGAGDFVLSQAQQVSKACGGKNTWITESGWPTQGESNGAAVPGTANQRAAIDSLKSAFSGNLILFTAYNDMWKSNNAGTYGAEQFWGMYGNAPSSQ